MGETTGSPALVMGWLFSPVVAMCAPNRPKHDN
jgi:hypothetical protein